ncbi:MAG: FHA domain-containing protein [Bacteroidales bacterium]|nr:FHA domain-containing protein [Bacteroidales bacterium]
MRCKNCGWPNEANIARCIKCNAPLQGSMSDFGRQNPTVPSSDGPVMLNATLRESSPSDAVNSSEKNPHNCPSCGYPVNPSGWECPVCHTRLNSICGDEARMVANDNPGSSRNNGSGVRAGGTINPWAVPAQESFCTLQRIPWQTEKVTYEPVSYSGTSIALNRSNTDSNNNSITSREQAVITCENGEWYIENRSDMKTTLLRVDRRVKLEDGDVIVLGNRMFEFRKG